MRITTPNKLHKPAGSIYSPCFPKTDTSLLPYLMGDLNKYCFDQL